MLMMTAPRTVFQRADIVAAMTSVLAQHRWAWQGADDAVAQWVAATDAKDLDIWCEDGARAQILRAVEEHLPAARVEHTDDPRRLRHTGWAVETDAGLAVVDVTFSDLRVGPVLLLEGSAVRVDQHRLLGAAAAADLFIRPLLRGRIVEGQRMAQARAAWAQAPGAERELAVNTWRASMGGLAPPVVAVLDGAAPGPDLVRQARLMLMKATMAPRNLTSTWRQRRTIVPSGRRAGPLGHRAKGVVVATVGTDGSGKSTVAQQACARLESYGFTTRTAYFGMARGNLPGVAFARKVLGVPEPGGEDKSKPVAQTSDDSDAQLDHPGLRKAAAWFYALEYGWRYLSTVAGPKRRGEVVICDRYVYDLRESPWPGSKAAKFAQWLVPAPDIMALPDAPAQMIHARKPERSLAEQSAQQQMFRDLLAEAPGRSANLIIDTSGASQDSVGPLVRAVISAAHLDPIEEL